MKVRSRAGHCRPVAYCLLFGLFCVSASLRLIFPVEAHAQVRPVNDYGALGLEQVLKRLNTTASVMMIGAHPDDEDSALLAYLARGENARTAYLSLTRGDGGQNIIGPELFESLGVIRTEELLQARRLDGAEQYFARAYDYGFSKTLDEARQKWPEDVIKCDVVRAIRTFRPLVVISRFTGTLADGHGHHQYSGYISPIAVKAAADATQCTDAGPIWQVLKFYVEQGFGDSSQPTLRINTGKYDPLLGRSYFEIAMEGRSQHRSQGEGRLELHGDQFSGLNLVESHVATVEKESSIFDGIDTTVAGSDVPIQPALNDPQPSLVELISKLPAQPNDRYMSLVTAMIKVSGLQVDALADRETVVPGDEFGVSVKVFFHGFSNISVKGISWTIPNGWQITKGEPPRENIQGFVRRETADYTDYYRVKVPGTAKPTAPYWLEKVRTGDLFEWPIDGDRNLPFQLPLMIAKTTIEIRGKEFVVEQPVQYRFADPARGEIRRDLNIVPALSVALDQDHLVIPKNAKQQERRLTMTVTNNSSGPIKGIARLDTNSASGLRLEPASANFELKNKGEKASIVFNVTVRPNVIDGTYQLTGVAIAGDATFDQEIHTISYPHIQTHRFYTRAVTKAEVMDLKVAPVNVGYIMGSGDEVPDAIRQMGLNVTMIDGLATADLSKFDTIVVGIRASEVRPDFVANNQKLLDWVKSGGNLVVQYQRPSFVQQNLVPFPVNMNDTQRTVAGSTSRVVDENAKVTILQPAHPVFNFPNKITDADFEGWIQERNLYNFVSFDKQYTPLLESHDAGERPNNGGMVLAQIGKGTYVYTSYSWFRQLPAGVPGAYRIFANLLSLSKKSAK